MVKPVERILSVKRIVLIVALFSLVVPAGCGGRAAVTQELTNVDPARAAEIIEQGGDVVILDIRTPEEYAGGKLDGALNIDFYASDFSAQLDQLDKDSHYLVYCRSGNRSGQAMPVFEQLGFAKVDNLQGGIVAWYEQGYSVVP